MRRVAAMAVGVAFWGVAAQAQSMTEAGAAIAGGAVGSAAGKSVSNGVSTIFDKVSKQTSGAAADTKKKAAKAPAPDVPGGALIEAGPGLPQGASPSSAAAPSKPARKPKPKAPAEEAAVAPPPRGDDVPPPPALPGRPSIAAKPAPAPVLSAAAPVRPVPVAPPPPPPPVVIPPVTLEDLQKIAPGMARRDVLRIGQPASRITMFEDGGLLEIYSYRTRDPQFGDRTIGTVRLNDGTVSGVQLRP